MIDFSDTNKLIDKIRFYIEFDLDDDEDLELINETIYEIRKKDDLRRTNAIHTKSYRR